MDQELSIPRKKTLSEEFIWQCTRDSLNKVPFSLFLNHPRRNSIHLNNYDVITTPIRNKTLPPIAAIYSKAAFLYVSGKSALEK
jgi:hypothetical protein